MMGLACWHHGPASAPPGVSQCVVYRFSLQIRFPLSSPSWTSVSCCVPPWGHPRVHGGYELGSQSHLAALAAPCQSPTGQTGGSAGALSSRQGPGVEDLVPGVPAVACPQQVRGGALSQENARHLWTGPAALWSRP